MIAVQALTNRHSGHVRANLFSIVGTNDISAKEAQDYLKKFAQAAFVTYTSEVRSTGMLMLKNDESLAKIITTWISEYLPK